MLYFVSMVDLLYPYNVRINRLQIGGRFQLFTKTEKSLVSEGAAFVVVVE